MNRQNKNMKNLEDPPMKRADQGHFYNDGDGNDDIIKDATP